MQYTKWPQNIPNGRKIYPYLTLQDPPNLTRIGILGLKICHLATLVPTANSDDGQTHVTNVFHHFFNSHLRQSYFADI
jgi:hypothetical protein